MKKLLLSAALIAASVSVSAEMLETFETATPWASWSAADYNQENNAEGRFFSFDATRPPLALVDNPNKVGINTSNKCVSVKVFSGGANSGIIRINFAAAPSGGIPIIAFPQRPAGFEDLLYYDRLRFKYYKGALMNRYIEFEPNGTATAPKTIRQAEAVEDWEYVTFELLSKSYNNFQIRVNRNETGTGSALGTLDGDYIYVDDFELYNSNDGPTSVGDTPTTSALMSCVPAGNGSYALHVRNQESSDLKVELIGLDGRTNVLFCGYAPAEVKLSFTVKNRGLYMIRLSNGSQVAETLKFIAR